MIWIGSLLMSFAISSLLWVFLMQREQQNILKNRLTRLKRNTSVESEDAKDSAKSNSKKFIREQTQKQSRQAKTPLGVLLLMSLGLGLGWHTLQPGGFVLKFVMSFLIITICQRFMNAKRITQRRKRIEEELPGMLDLLCVCSESGMSIQHGLSRVVQENKGTPLAEEFQHTFHELNLGVPLDKAFRQLGDRSQVADLRAFATSVIQSNKLGISLTETLKSQARLLRETTRMKTREKVFKVPVKLTVPLVMFILPAVFIVILGPVVLQVTNGLFKQIAAGTL